MANSTNVIHAAATLAKATGKVFVRHPDGTQSVLKVGAQLNVGDVVVSSPGAHAEIQVAEGQLIKIGGAAGDALTIDKSILDTPADHHDVKADAATDFNKIIENLAKGNDIGDDLDPTAAGAAGGDLMSGNVYVVVNPIETTTTPSPFENVNSPSANA
ncbi:MAG: retention module-containing protein, partial [Methylophilaceae bacterium]